MEHTTAPLVTIAIPTYNRASGYLRNAIECALKQTYPNIELVISDNCSSDNTEEIVTGYADPRIRYFRQDVNIGANNNFNFCVEKAKGSYFLLFHDDDAIDADFMEACMRSVGCRTDVGLIRTGVRIIDGEGNIRSEHRNLVTGSTIEDLFLDWFTGKTPLFLCNSLFNTARLKEIGGFRSRTNLYQDVVAEFQLAARYGRVDVSEVKASFRRHTDNMGSAAKVNDWCEDSLFLLNVMCDLAPNDAGLLRSRGMRYFSIQNYDRAARIQSPMRRFYSYAIVYKKFAYSYSPFHFFLTRNVLYYALQFFKRRIIKGK